MSTVHSDADRSTIKVDFPPVFGYSGLALLLGRSEASLRCDRVRKPWTIPPACTPPGTKSPRWLLTDVLSWLAQHREQTGKPSPRSKPGRRSKSEEVAARRSALAGASI